MINGNNSVDLKLSWVDVRRRALAVYLVAHRIIRLIEINTYEIEYWDVDS